MPKYNNLLTNTLSTPFVYFNQADSLENEYAKDNFDCGVRAMNKSDVNFALKCFTDALKDAPDSFHVINNIAAFYGSYGRTSDSAKFFETGISKHPKNAQLRYNYGTLLYMNNAYKDAQRQLEQAHSLDAKNIPILNNLALSHLFLGETERAQEVLNETIAIDSTFDIAHHNIAHALMRKNEFEKAIESFQKAISISKNNNSMSYNDMGCCYCHLRKTNDAVECFKKSYELDNNFRLPCYNLGCIAMTNNIKISEAKTK
jgi:Tfp pilus assembly protein PilF